MPGYDEAADSLFQVPHGQFTEERKRLVGELKAAGDKMAASRLSRLQRPPVTAWAVNQLYWHARDAVDNLFALATRLRNGDLSATTAHREALAKLRQRAAAILGDAGHGANEATLRRIALTLSAVAAAGTWMPDGPGQLAADRDPPGFDAVAVINAPTAPLPAKVEPVKYDFNAPAVVAPPPPAPPPVAAPSTPAAPKRSAVQELAAKRKEMAEEEKRRKKAEADGEIDPIRPPADEVDAEAADEVVAAPRARPSLSIVPPMGAPAVDDADEDDDDDDATASGEPADDDADGDDDGDSDGDGDDADGDDDGDGDDGDDDGDDEGDEEPPSAATASGKKLTALDQLAARRKQQRDEADAERRRKFMEDGGTRDAVIAKRMLEAKRSNDEASTTKRDRVEAAVRAKLDAKAASTEARRVTRDSDDDDSDDDEDDGDDAPALSVKPGGRGPASPPQPSDLIAKLAAKLGANAPAVAPPDEDDEDDEVDDDEVDDEADDSDDSAKPAPPARPNPYAKLSTGASPARGIAAPGRPLSTGASPARGGAPLSTGASPARGMPSKLSTGASPARGTEAAEPPARAGGWPRAATPSPSRLAPTAPTPSPPAKPSPAARTSASAGAKADPERRKLEARAKLRAQIEARLQEADAVVTAAEQRVEQLTAELSEADDALEQAREAAQDLRDQLDVLE